MRLRGTGTFLVVLLASAGPALVLASTAAAQAHRRDGRNASSARGPRRHLRDAAATTSSGAAAATTSSTGERGADILQGDVGNDSPVGDALEDTLDGGGGNDVLHRGWGTDVIDGGDGERRPHGRRERRSGRRLDCGAGRRPVVLSRKDQAFGCETVRRVNIRGPHPERQPSSRRPPGDDVWNGVLRQRHSTPRPGLGGRRRPRRASRAGRHLGNEGNDTPGRGQRSRLAPRRPGDDLLAGRRGQRPALGRLGLRSAVRRHRRRRADLDRRGPASRYHRCGDGHDRVVAVFGDDRIVRTRLTARSQSSSYVLANPSGRLRAR